VGDKGCNNPTTHNGEVQNVKKSLNTAFDRLTGAANSTTFGIQTFGTWRPKAYDTIPMTSEYTSGINRPD